MTKIDKHIEIVSSSTGRLSSMSKKSYLMAQAALSKYYTTVGVTLVSSHADLLELVQKKPDMVFLGAKRVPLLPASERTAGTKVEYIWLSEFLDNHHIPYTGSPAEGHKNDHSKIKAKAIVMAAGFNTAKYFMAFKGEYTDESQLPLTFPLFIKPPRLGGGLGVGPDSVVRDFAAFTAKVDALHDEFKSEALVEQYLEGREFTVAVLRSADRSELYTMPIEMLPVTNECGDKVIGHEMKASPVETPTAVVAEGPVKESVKALAKAVFTAIGARDYGRIDMRLGTDGEPYFLEANLIPSIINGSGNFQKSCLMNAGIPYEDMLLHILDLAFARSGSNETLPSLSNIRRASSLTAK